MPTKTSSVGVKVTANADGYEIEGGTTPRTLTVTGGNATITGGGAYTHTLPAATGTLALFQASPQTYRIQKVSSTYYLYDDTDGLPVTSNSSLDTVWTSLLSDMGSNPTVIEFGPGTFTTTAGLSLSKSNVHVRGQGIGVTTLSADSGTGTDATPFFKTDPSNAVADYALTVDATAGNLTLTMSSANLVSSGIVAGDYIILYSSLSIDSEFTSRNQGELHRVVSVDTGTGVITIGTTNNGTHVYQTTTVANTAKVRKLTMYKNISVSDMSFTDAASARPASYTLGGVTFRFVDNLTITNCSFENMFNSGLYIGQTMNTRISGCFFKNIKDLSTPANTFYGIQVRGAAINTTISNCSFENMRHGVVQGAGTTTAYAGVTRNYTVANCSFLNTYTSHIDCHQGAEGVSFVNNTMVGDDGSANGIQSRSAATITGNTVVGVLGKGIMLFGNASGSVISGNVIKGCSTGIGIDVHPNKVVIANNSISGGGMGIDLSDTTYTATMTIASPCVVTKTSHNFAPGTVVSFSTSGALPTGISTVTPYYVSSTGLTTDTFQISATDGGASVNTSGSQSGTHTLRVNGGNDSIIIGNHIFSNTSVGINGGSQMRVKVSNNLLRANTVPIAVNDFDGITKDWQINDNYFEGHTTSNTPTMLGTGHKIYNNQGYNFLKTAVSTPFPASTGNVSNLTGAQASMTTLHEYTNVWSPKIFTITGGTVTAIRINGITTGLTAGSFRLDIGETISITHSSAPTCTVLIA